MAQFFEWRSDHHLTPTHHPPHRHSPSPFKTTRSLSNMTNGIVNGSSGLENQFGQYSVRHRRRRSAVLILRAVSFSRYQRHKVCVRASSFTKLAAGCLIPYHYHRVGLFMALCAFLFR